VQVAVGEVLSVEGEQAGGEGLLAAARPYMLREDGFCQAVGCLALAYTLHIVGIGVTMDVMHVSDFFNVKIFTCGASKGQDQWSVKVLKLPRGKSIHNCIDAFALPLDVFLQAVRYTTRHDNMRLA
jgi:hypothetical protein